MKLAFVLAKYYQGSGSLPRGSQWTFSSVTKLLISFDIILMSPLTWITEKVLERERLKTKETNFVGRTTYKFLTK